MILYARRLELLRNPEIGGGSDPPRPSTSTKVTQSKTTRHKEKALQQACNQDKIKPKLGVLGTSHDLLKVSCSHLTPLPPPKRHSINTLHATLAGSKTLRRCTRYPRASCLLWLSTCNMHPYLFASCASADDVCLPVCVFSASTFAHNCKDIRARLLVYCCKKCCLAVCVGARGRGGVFFTVQGIKKSDAYTPIYASGYLHDGLSQRWGNTWWTAFLCGMYT